MSSKKKSMAAVAPESPLVPNRVMRRMYAGMVEARLLEAHLLIARPGRKRRSAAHGQEACRVSALLDLGAEDFSSDVPGSATAVYLRGEKLASLREPQFPGVLPEVEDSRERLQRAVGVALALKRLRPDKVVVVFAGRDEVKPSVWRATWAAAAHLELPLLFVVLPPASGKAKPFVLSARATAAGVPGIPVDASDAIALYRVVQESLVRARAGGGPALMECIPFLPKGAKSGKRGAPPDPVAAMGEVLLRRKICGPEWLTGVEADFKSRLKHL